MMDRQYEELLRCFCDSSRGILGNNLVGIYLELLRELGYEPEEIIRTSYFSMLQHKMQGEFLKTEKK